MGMHTPSDTAIPPAGAHPTDTLTTVPKTSKERHSLLVCSGLRTRDNLSGGLVAQVTVYLFPVFQGNGAQLKREVQL